MLYHNQKISMNSNSIFYFYEIEFQFRFINETIDEDDLDEIENEYNRLVPEYNHLIDYLKSVSDKFSLLEQQFNDEQVCLFFFLVLSS